MIKRRNGVGYRGAAEVHWYEAHGIGSVKKDKNQTILGLKTMEKKPLETQFALCIENNGCEDLEKRKFYQILPDECF